MIDESLTRALNAGKRIITSSNSKTRRIRTPELPQPSKLPDQSSKYCPQCLAENNQKVKRRRHYRLYGPLFKSDCGQNLLVLSARVSSRKAWWNVGPIRWLIAPPDPATEYPWFESRTFARCPRHGDTEVSELNGIRQFGRIRRPFLWFKVWVTRTLDIVIPLR